MKFSFINLVSFPKVSHFRRILNYLNSTILLRILMTRCGHIYVLKLKRISQFTHTHLLIDTYFNKDKYDFQLSVDFILSLEMLYSSDV